MKVIINSENTLLDEIQTTASINEVTRQFTLKDISNTQKYFKGDIVEIYDDKDILIIEAEIEYIGATGNKETSEFVYAGRNNAKYIVDSYADKTIQITENQNVNSVIKDLVSEYGLEINGDAKLPTDEIKTILIGDNIGIAILEIVQSAGKIITSDEKGNLLIEFEAKESSKKELEYGVNIRERSYINNSTDVYDKYVVVSQSNYIVKQEQEVNVQGIYGDGKRTKVILSTHTLTEAECRKLAEIEYKKDVRKSIEYSVIVDDADLELNKKYSIKDEAIELDEEMNLKAIEIRMSADTDEVRAFFERIV